MQLKSVCALQCFTCPTHRGFAVLGFSGVGEFVDLILGVVKVQRQL